MRKVAAFVDETRPQVMGVCDIDAGDALWLATRFALQWAYRGKQAVFWDAPLHARAVHDRYLPVRGVRLFDRRGLLMVDADFDGMPCIIAATQLSIEREWFIPELRFARRHLRGAHAALLFADMPRSRIGFGDLGFAGIADGVFARGIDRALLAATTLTV